LNDVACILNLIEFIIGFRFKWNELNLRFNWIEYKLRFNSIQIKIQLSWFQIQLKRNGMWIGGGGIEFACEYGTLEKFKNLKIKITIKTLFHASLFGNGLNIIGIW